MTNTTTINNNYYIIDLQKKIKIKKNLIWKMWMMKIIIIVQMKYKKKIKK